MKGEELNYENTPSKIYMDEKELFPDIDLAISGFEALIYW
jgi:hypothetical protein